MEHQLISLKNKALLLVAFWLVYSALFLFWLENGNFYELDFVIIIQSVNFFVNYIFLITFVLIFSSFVKNYLKIRGNKSIINIFSIIMALIPLFEILRNIYKIDTKVFCDKADFSAYWLTRGCEHYINFSVNFFMVSLIILVFLLIFSFFQNAALKLKRNA